MSEVISLIIPIYNGEENIERVYSEIKKILPLLERYEIVYLDDGSTDATLQKLKDIKRENNNIKIVQFKRNFGQHPALTVGFSLSKGDYIITLDNDLEIHPSEAIKLLKEIKVRNYDMVSGYRIGRKKGWRLFFSRIFNYLTRIFSGVNIRDFGCPLKVFNQKLVKEIVKYGGIINFLPQLKRYKVMEVEIESKEFSKSHYNLFRLSRLAFTVFKNLLIPPSPLPPNKLLNMVEEIF